MRTISSSRPAGRLADRLDLHERVRAIDFEQPIEIRQAIRLDARDVQPRPGIVDAQLHAIAGETLGRHRLHTFPSSEIATVFSSPATEPGWPFQTLSRLRNSSVSVEPGWRAAGNECVPPRGSATRARGRRGVDADDAVDDLVPERRGVLEARVDEAHCWRRRLLRVGGRDEERARD